MIRFPGANNDEVLLHNDKTINLQKQRITIMQNTKKQQVPDVLKRKQTKQKKRGLKRVKDYVHLESRNW
jgi:hypothetical protein